MIKFSIAILVLLAAGVIWLRAQWARSKNSNEAKQIIDDLKSGKYVIESYAEALSIMISSRTYEAGTDPAVTVSRFRALTGKQLLGKYSIQYADMNENGKGILIAEAKAKEIIAGYAGNKEIDIHFPCWLYIDTDTEKSKIDFRSTFPENKDHHFLLEDLSTELYHHHLKP